jgi:purine-cytosine permease-like protein
MFWSRILVILGSVAMLLGAVDPLEGSLLILPGSGLVTAGVFLGKRKRGTLVYWSCVFLLIAVGVGAMFGLSAAGGFGGENGLSMWWGLFVLPYPLGLILALIGGIAGLIRFFKAKGQPAQD